MKEILVQPGEHVTAGDVIVRLIGVESAQAELAAEGKTAAEIRALAAHKVFSGNRPTNSILYRQLTLMAHELGQTEKAGAFTARASEIATRIQRFMWSEADGIYYDVDDFGVQVKVKTIAAFWPMLAALAATAVMLVPGVGLAWLLARRVFPGKAIVEALVALPLVMPPVATIVPCPFMSLGTDALVPKPPGFVRVTPAPRSSSGLILPTRERWMRSSNAARKSSPSGRWALW